MIKNVIIFRILNVRITHINYLDALLLYIVTSINMVKRQCGRVLMRLVKAAVCNLIMIKCISKAHVCMDYQISLGHVLKQYDGHSKTMGMGRRRGARVRVCVRVRRRVRGGETGEGSVALSRGEWCRLRAKRTMRTH